MDFKHITLFPELIEDALLYVLLAVLLCIAAKLLYDRKEKRRLAREFAEHQARKESQQD